MAELDRLLRSTAPRPGRGFDAADLRRRVGRRRRRRRAAVAASGLATVIVVAGVGWAAIDRAGRDRPLDVVTQPRPGGDAGPAESGPDTFVAAEDGRIAAFDSRTGHRERFLTEPTPGGGDAEPVLGGGTVWFVRGAGSCSAGVWRVSSAGGAATEVVPAGDGAATGVAVSADGRKLAWVEQPCQGEAVLKTRDLGSGDERTFPMGNPLQVHGKPAWAPDDRHLAYFYRGGGGAPYGVRVLDTAAAGHADDGRPLAATVGCYQTHPGYLPDGSLVVVTCAGEGPRPDAFAAVRFDAASGRRLGVLFTLAGAGPDVVMDQVTSFDLSVDGRSALYQITLDASQGGQATGTWRWDGGDPQALSTSGRSPAW